MSSLDWGSVADVVDVPITSAGETFYLAEGGFARSVRGLRVGPGFIEGLGVETAARSTLIALEVAGTLVLLAARLAIGVLGAIAVGRTLESQIVGVHAFDVRTILPIAGSLAAAALLAT